MSDVMPIWNWIRAGGFAMIPLLICSALTWAIILERLWVYRRMGKGLFDFHASASQLVLQDELERLRRFCEAQSHLPTAELVRSALERLHAKDARVREKWLEAVERRRHLINQELRRNLWILGTIGSASPFIGLFGTVVGILRSFQEMARTGTGGFNVVAAGISESLIATASGIVVAVVAVMAYNAFQTRWTGLVLLIKLQTEELTDMLAPKGPGERPNGA